MNIVEFFDHSVGKWFSQRTSYQLAQKEQWHQSDKTDVFMSLLPRQEPELARIVQASKLDPAQVQAVLKVEWQQTPMKKAGTSFMIAIANTPDDTEGLLLRSIMAPGQSPVLGRYQLNGDESIVLISEAGNFYVEERIWFAAPNLRLRTSLMRNGPEGFENSSFYSEIRMVPPPERAVA
jgi:hypothetical protein